MLNTEFDGRRPKISADGFVLLDTEGLTPETLQGMYNASVMIPAILFLLVYLVLRFYDPLGKKQVEEMQVQKEQLLAKQNETEQ